MVKQIFVENLPGSAVLVWPVRLVGLVRGDLIKAHMFPSDIMNVLLQNKDITLMFSNLETKTVFIQSLNSINRKSFAVLEANKVVFTVK